MKDIDFLIKHKGDTPSVMCSIFENTITLDKDKQGAITLTVALQIRPHTKHIGIKYHPSRSFVKNGNLEIQHIDTKEHIVDMFQSRYILSCLDIYATILMVGR